VEVADRMRRQLLASARAGETIERTAERLLDEGDPLVRVPQHVEELHAAARDVAPGDPDSRAAFERVVGRWARRVQRLGQAPDTRPGAYTMRSATQQMVKDLRRARAENVDRIVDRWVLQRARHQARVIARHETVEAYRDAYQRTTQDNPAVKGYRWQLSTKHPHADVCDLYANQNLHGLGPGGYPAAELPDTPHPSCLCVQVAIVDRFHMRRELAAARGEPEPPREWDVGGHETAAEWLAKQPAGYREDLLGPTRARIFEREPHRVLSARGEPIPVHRVLGLPRPTRRLGRAVAATPLVRADRLRMVRPFPPAPTLEPPAPPPPPLHERLVEDPTVRLGGAGEKQILRDPLTGQRFIFKVAAAKGTGAAEEFRAHAQVAWSDIARRVRPEHIAVELHTRDGRVGTLQPLLELADPPDFRAGRINPRDLSRDEARQVATEHVLDWALSQHDTHSENLIRTRDGRILSIDKEQGWRYLGQDRLATDYHPNARYGEEEPYYNRFWRSFEQGEVDFDPLAMREAIDRLDAIPESELREAFAPYAHARHANSPLLQEDFLEEAVERVRSTRADFERFLTDRMQVRHGAGSFTFENGWVSDDLHARLSTADIEAATNHGRRALRDGSVTPTRSKLEHSNASRIRAEADRLHGLRRAIGGDRIGGLSDAIISRWAGESTDDAAAVVVEALELPHAREQWRTPPPAGVSDAEHAERLLDAAARSIGGVYRGAYGGAPVSAEEVVDAMRVQLAATRAMLEHEGVSRPGQTHTVIRAIGGSAAHDVRRARDRGETTVRVPVRAAVSTADATTSSATESGGFGDVVLEFEVSHERILSHHAIDGELLSGEGEVVVMVPEGYVEVEMRRIRFR
jgi:hypothetical protein